MMRFDRGLLSAAVVAAVSGSIIVLYDKRPEWLASASPFLVMVVVGLLAFVTLPSLLRRAFPIESSDRGPERLFGPIRPLSVALVLTSLVWAIVMHERLRNPPWAVFIIPLILVSIWLLSWVWPRISPRAFALAPVRRIHAMSEVTTLSIFLLAGIARFGGLGSSIRPVDVVEFGLGVSFIVVGNVLGKIPQNYFVGIRTPWTLASEEVWLRTQRVGGKVMMAGGAMLMIADLTGEVRQWFLPILVANVTIPMAYSYVLHRRLVNPKAG